MGFFLIVITIIILFSVFSEKGSKTSRPTKSLPLDLADATAQQHYSKALRAENKRDERLAIEYYTKAISCKPKAIYYSGRANAKMKINDYKGADEDHSLAIFLEPNEALFWLNRGLTYKLKGEREYAISDLEKAVELGSNKAKALLEALHRSSSSPSYIPQREYQKKSTPNYQQVDDPILRKHGINFLHHITHKNNIESILSLGLLSHNAAHNGPNKVNIADNEVNMRRGKNEPIHGRSIHEYVPLYFNAKNPMLFKRSNIQSELIIIGVEANVIKQSNAIFTDGNAASSATKFYNDLTKLGDLNWACIKDDYWNNYPDGKRLKCAEVLVFSKVDVSSIKKIFCNSPAAYDYVKPIIIKHPHIKLEIVSNLFFYVGHNAASTSLNNDCNTSEYIDDLPF